MNCIIIDDEPLAREAMEMLVEENKELCLLSMFNNAVSAARFMEEHSVDLIFLDIQMPGITGIEFAHTVSKRTLIIFTTAYTEYALDSYEVDAIDYLVKPIETERFQKAVQKALSYHSLLMKEEKEAIEACIFRVFLYQVRTEIFQSKLCRYSLHRRIERLCNPSITGAAHHNPYEYERHLRALAPGSVPPCKQVLYRQYPSHRFI